MTVVNFEVTSDNFVNYIIKVVGSGDITFHIKDRYSSIRNFQEMVKRNIVSPVVMPNFPQKKLWGNMEPSFLMQRQKHLEFFLNSFLAHPRVCTSRLVHNYFIEKA